MGLGPAQEPRPRPLPLIAGAGTAYRASLLRWVALVAGGVLLATAAYFKSSQATRAAASPA
ncbi:MAG: hypothetical protein AB1609_11320, partial [Bacillota bacterium]